MITVISVIIVNRVNSVIKVMLKVNSVIKVMVEIIDCFCDKFGEFEKENMQNSRKFVLFEICSCDIVQNYDIPEIYHKN